MHRLSYFDTKYRQLIFLLTVVLKIISHKAKQKMDNDYSNNDDFGSSDIFGGSDDDLDFMDDEMEGMHFDDEDSSDPEDSFH